MAGKQKDLGPLTIGLDIGIASVGWAVLAQNKIVDMGVRVFDAAEDKDGKPNNQTRRGARVSRNRYDMRSWRLKKLIRLFRDTGLLTKPEIKHLFSAQHDKNVKHVSPWTLRAKGLARALSKQEWAQVIFHIVKHRGFKFFSKSEDPTRPESEDEDTTDLAAKAEREGLREGLTYTSTLLKRHPQFQTLGQAAYLLANAQQDKDGIYRDSSGEELDTKDCEEFQNAYRNKGKSYRHAFQRDDLKAELNALFDAQHKHGNPYADLTLPDEIEHLIGIAVGSEIRRVEPTFRAHVFALLELQRPPISIEQMDAMIGYCDLESEARNGKGKAERRAAKHTFSNERATWLQTLNNLRIKCDGKDRLSKEERDQFPNWPQDGLTPNEREILLNLPYTQAKLTFKQVREILREQTGFPAHWHEASFTKLSYCNKRKYDGSWINVVTSEGKNATLNKYLKDKKDHKDINKELKQRLEAGVMTLAELRQLCRLEEGETFVCLRKSEEVISSVLEDQYPISFDDLDNKKVFIKIMQAKSKEAKKLSPCAANALESLRNRPDATLADLRIAIEQSEKLERGWQFEKSLKDINPILLEHENKTNVPIEYEDAQKVEEETLIELKGWHTFRRGLENDNMEWWGNLQSAWREPQSDAGRAAAHQLDEIAEVLTKAQTDADMGKGLAPLQLNEIQLRALEGMRFKQYRNLSLKALRNILPFLEQGKNYKEACDLAGYQSVTPPPRERFLPPLETYLYERIRHGRENGFRKTGHKELRYKDLTNPVVARAFNQARLVLNALIDRYGQSPAYVHVELAHDIAKPLKGKWSNGKYIEGRLDIQNRQKENRNKRQLVRDHFAETYNISNPGEFEILKERLYREQQHTCLYTLEFLDLDRVIYDKNYVQIDHIWPRSRTFDNSQENLVLVKAHANQNKGNRIPYHYINSHHLFGNTEAKRSEHWRKIAKHVMACKSMSESKQKRLLATELDADEFLARNLVDTRYITRLFAHMVRDRLLFDGQTEDRIEDIDPLESGKSRLEKFHKTRVRTPQGGVVDFLRRKWLGDIKDRDAGNKHHAMDACIIAACTPELIHRVNSWFSNQEKVPSRFKKTDNDDYIDRVTGEIISKDEARGRGLYLPPPWDEFRRDFLKRYRSVFVSRVISKKRNVELHDANPMGIRYYPVRLIDLTLDMLDEKHLPPELPEKRLLLICAIKQLLLSCNGDAETAFQNGFRIKNAKEKETFIHTLPLPLISLPEDYLKKSRKQEVKSKTIENFKDSARKNFSISELSLSKLEEKSVGTVFYNRNKRLIDALRKQLKKFDGDAKKAFAEPFYPFGKDKNHHPIKSIRLPAPRGSGIFVRGGISNLGDALYTEMYRHEDSYWFRARYKTQEEVMFGLPATPKEAQHICNFKKNDLVRIQHPNLAYCYREIRRYKDPLGNTLIDVEAIFRNRVFEGYWNYFEPSNDRPVVQLHDSSPFFLLEDAKTLDKEFLTLIERKKEKKGAKATATKAKEKEEIEYVEFSTPPQQSPLRFSLVSDIKRKINDAVFIERIKVGILGVDQEEQS
ncbi:MAG: type II CRISPR RNA-guided endonuclease Cas9 [Azoarcus sp.]|jgi:CRISPR/Cas system Type II protein with McrA/HNH and RuvC-like nuclease domain|nr:type II CRISPR RNA-guided endonuclease Cas9 [Azoarcus sp.]